eukprot:7814769-Alexandrium_andersonii.AAC.1
MHPSRARGTDSEAFSWARAVQVRTLEAILHFTYGGLRVEADCSTDEHWSAYANWVSANGWQLFL